MESLLTKALLDGIRICSLWPPGAYPLSKEMLVLVARNTLLASSPNWKTALDDDDWYSAGGSPCLILGPAKMAPSGKYVPEEDYSVEGALRLTLLHRQPQREAEAKSRALAQRFQDGERIKAERHEQWLRATEQQRRERELKEASARLDPLKKMAEMERRLAELEAVKSVP